MYISIAKKICIIPVSPSTYPPICAPKKKTSIELQENVASLWNASVSVKMRARCHNHKPRYICMRANEKPISTAILSRIQQEVRQKTKKREKEEQRGKKEEKPVASLVNIRSGGELTETTDDHR